MHKTDFFTPISDNRRDPFRSISQEIFFIVIKRRKPFNDIEAFAVKC